MDCYCYTKYTTYCYCSIERCLNGIEYTETKQISAVIFSLGIRAFPLPNLWFMFWLCYLFICLFSLFSLFLFPLHALSHFDFLGSCMQCNRFLLNEKSGIKMSLRKRLWVPKVAFHLHLHGLWNALLWHRYRAFVCRFYNDTQVESRYKTNIFNGIVCRLNVWFHFYLVFHSIFGIRNGVCVWVCVCGL